MGSLSPAEAEAAWILTGCADAGRRLSSATSAALRGALQSVALTIHSLRPAIQRELWRGHCSAYLPCPYPNTHIRKQKPRTASDADVHQWLLQQPTTVTRWAEAALSSPSPEPLFHAASSSGAHFLPGETVDDQRLAMRFQDELYARQHPVNCSAMPILIMDYFHNAGGFGSWSHARAVALGLGVRANRTVIELPGKQGYTQGAYSNCTRLRGLGGCDIFCPPPRARCRTTGRRWWSETRPTSPGATDPGRAAVCSNTSWYASSTSYDAPVSSVSQCTHTLSTPLFLSLSLPVVPQGPQVRPAHGVLS